MSWPLLLMGVAMQCRVNDFQRGNARFNHEFMSTTIYQAVRLSIIVSLRRTA